MKLLDATLIASIHHDVDAFDGDFKRWCALNNIPRSTAYRHKKRITEEGAWQARSHRPEHCPHHTPPEVEKAVLDQRRKLRRDNGADNIAYHLDRVATEQHWSEKGWRIPSRATINKILSRNNVVEAQPQKRPKSSYRRFAYARPRDCYQIDATEVSLLGGEKATVFEVLDDCTRVLVATHVTDAETSIGAITAIRAAFTDYGVPAIVLSDNGPAFTSRFLKGGTSQFTRACTGHRARLIHSSPYHPQTCGKVERHHRTFKEWLADQPTAPRTRRQLQDLCDQYQQYYNTERRHSAWNKPPLQAWKDKPLHGGPSELPIQQDATVRTLLASSSGRITITGITITVGALYARQRLTIVTDGDHVTVYKPNGQPLGHLHIDTATPKSGSRLIAA
ncbi:integrase-like protein [Antricoccus suffuscus]|uniref:Integrase-like protein n=2 Tax=Antricoccus suffuscus TaxID=1629062 RepID=A0A2T0YXH6_9ACTN|nr:integrase-like protein [Antricoccus suffuscus]